MSEKLTPKRAPWEDTFLSELALRCNVRDACEVAGIARRTAYDRRERYEYFAQLWDDALSHGVSRMDREVHRRAFEGVPEDEGRRYSDVLAMFLLKAHGGDKYRDKRQVEHTLPPGAAIRDALAAMGDSVPSEDGP